MASKRAVRRRGCQDKVRHATKEAAFAALRNVIDADNLSVYQCPACHGWHLGHHNSYYRRGTTRSLFR